MLYNSTLNYKSKFENVSMSECQFRSQTDHAMERLPNLRIEL